MLLFTNHLTRGFSADIEMLEGFDMVDSIVPATHASTCRAPSHAITAWEFDNLVDVRAKSVRITYKLPWHCHGLHTRRHIEMPCVGH
jgi:hypothetical protein